jgi:deoxyadenosine/deoxycytidine kinase
VTIPRYIAIEGPIGVGKTSFATLLGERFDAEIIYEVVDENPFLGKFYSDRKSYAFQTQIFFLMSRYKQLTGLAQRSLFSDYLICDYLFQRDLLFAQLNLDDAEYALYLEIYRALIKKVPQPDLVVYLQAETPRLMGRITKRGRVVERGVEENYFDKVNRVFNEFFFNYREGALLIINTNQIDFVGNDMDLTTLINKLESGVRGVEYFNPPGSVF